MVENKEGDTKAGSNNRNPRKMKFDQRVIHKQKNQKVLEKKWGIHRTHEDQEIDTGMQETQTNQQIMRKTTGLNTQELIH